MHDSKPELKSETQSVAIDIFHIGVFFLYFSTFPPPCALFNNAFQNPVGSSLSEYVRLNFLQFLGSFMLGKVNNCRTNSMGNHFNFPKICISMYECLPLSVGLFHSVYLLGCLYVSPHSPPITNGCFLAKPKTRQRFH